MADMKQRLRSFLLSLAALLAGVGSAGAGEAVVLVDDNGPRYRIELSESASPSERLGAKELEKYLGVTERESCPVRIRIVVDSADAELKPEGFSIAADAEGVTVTGGSPIGSLYGVYTLLRDHAGMRWLLPTPDGEYCVREGRTVSVPFGKRVENPFMRIRRTVSACGQEAKLWHARNLMTMDVRPTPDDSENLLDMMSGWAGKDTKAAIDALFAEHPEYFPLVRGERRPIYGAGDPNPCVSNAGLLGLMAENLYRYIRGKRDGGCVTIGCNDTSAWCECGKCRALDAPESFGTKGARADRYWHTVGEIAKRVWLKDPEVKLGGCAYRDFLCPPETVAVDPRLRILVGFGSQCWRHAVDDDMCSVNRGWREVFRAWAKPGLPLVANRDEIGGLAGCSFAPVERVLYRNILAYPEFGCAGSSFCVHSPDEPVEFCRVKPPYFGKAQPWHAMWQTCYMGARAMWKGKLDFETELEEANRLYYGAAWEGGMKEFRRNLQVAFAATPGCCGCGLGASLGRCLDQAGLEEKLKRLIDDACQAATVSGDMRAFRHACRDRDIFERTWIRERQDYLADLKSGRSRSGSVGEIRERSSAGWSNPGLEETVPNAGLGPRQRWNALTFATGGDAVPKDWFGGELLGEYLEENGNHYLRLRPGKGSYLSQDYVSDRKGRVRISFRMRGRGKVALWTALHTDNESGRGYRMTGGTSKSRIFEAGPEWTSFTFDRFRKGSIAERMTVRFTPQEDSEIDLDDIVVSFVE